MFDMESTSSEDKKKKFAEKLKMLIKEMNMRDKDGEEEVSMEGVEEVEENEAPMSDENSMSEEPANELSAEEIAEMLKDGNKIPKKEGLVSMSIGGSKKSPVEKMVQSVSKSMKAKKKG